MPRYVDVDDLFTCGTCFHNRFGKCTTYCDHSESYRPAHDKFTIIEAEPVRHGYWINANYGRHYICSVCTRIYEIYGFDYCPNCGAKMDGVMEVKKDEV